MTEYSVLIVEDEENPLEALRYDFVKEGYRVNVADDGEVTLDIARGR